ncbi:hypothetical protein TDB9533_00058 [Thalassocella blandensis]|nr:hypothetical protein TDB9533_00058 [Thalassocella blandensis]
MYDDESYEDEPSGGGLTIEDLVGKAAESKSETDVDKLFAGLKGRELFLKTNEEDKNQIPIVKVNGNLTAFILYTSSEDERLTTIYGGTIWESALNMLLNMNAVEGLMIQSSTSSAYVCVTKEKAKSLFLVSQRNSLSVTY